MRPALQSFGLAVAQTAVHFGWLERPKFHDLRDIPDIDLVRPFAIMQQTNRAAFCWVVLRSRRHLAAPQQTGQRLQSEFFLRPLDEFDHRVERGLAEPSAR